MARRNAKKNDLEWVVNFIFLIFSSIIWIFVAIFKLIGAIIKSLVNENASSKEKTQEENNNIYKEDVYEKDPDYTKEQLEHLEPWQLELVKKGEYDPSGFEEEEPEDDDWHSDDEEETIK